MVDADDQSEPPRNDQHAPRAFGQADHPAGDIFGAHRNALEASQAAICSGFTGMPAKLGCGRAGVDGRDVDAERRYFASQGICEGAYAKLGGGVDGVQWGGNQACYRRHVDNVTRAPCQHMRQDNTRGLDHAQ